MRRLGMKNKRRKSDTMTDNESEENGVQRAANSDSDGNDAKNDTETTTDNTSHQTKRGQTKKRISNRGRHSLKSQSEEPVEGSQDEGGDEAQSINDTEQENGNAAKPTPNKRRKREDQRASTSQNKSNNEQEYEVEKIVGQRTIKGRRQFLVRWKGYSEDADTWEQEKDLNCSKLIEDFLTEEGDDREEQIVEKAKAKAKAAKADKKNKRTKNNLRNDSSKDDTDKKSDDKDQKEYEVEKIIEVHFKKNKTREFLIRWKGFTSADDTWEPEENLNCPDLINKFMEKLEKAKSTGVRELRTNPAHTKRYTLTTKESGRRLSRRNKDKQRTTYHECDG